MDLRSLRHALASDIDAQVGRFGGVEAAVLVIICGTATPSIIMTVKPHNMRQHADEVAFPGGKLEECDGDLLETAVREAREELGFRAQKNDIVGQLRVVYTQTTDYAITPFVCIVDRIACLTPNSEVDKVLCMPFEALLGTCRLDDALGLTFSYKGHVVWGASARILKDLGRRTNLL